MAVRQFFPHGPLGLFLLLMRSRFLNLLVMSCKFFLVAFPTNLWPVVNVNSMV
jgi:hypothetical protein